MKDIQDRLANISPDKRELLEKMLKYKGILRLPEGSAEQGDAAGDSKIGCVLNQATEGQEDVEAPPPPSSLARETQTLDPFHFGGAARTLFGLLRRPQQARGVGVVLCYPHAHEYIRCHRSFRELGRLLAGYGYHVLSFDYYGTGDSVGVYEDGSLSGWCDDITAAIAALKERAQLQHIALVGMRLGATLALRVAAQRSDIDALVLWDPIVSGANLHAELASIRELQRVDATRQRVAAPSSDVLCYTITPAMWDALLEIDLLHLMPRTMPPSLVLKTGKDDALHQFAERARETWPTLDYNSIDDVQVWLREPYELVVPARTIISILRWIERRLP